MQRKALLMSLQDASPAVQPENRAEIMAEEVAAEEEKERCILQYAQSAELLLKFLSCPRTIDPFIAASASRHVGNSGIFVVT